MAWVGSKEPAGSAVYFQRFDMSAKPLGEILRVTDDEPVAVGRPTIAWGGDGYGVVWHDSRYYEGSEIFFSAISCGSKDGEGLKEVFEGDTGKGTEPFGEDPGDEGVEGRGPGDEGSELKKVF